MKNYKHHIVGGLAVTISNCAILHPHPPIQFCQLTLLVHGKVGGQ